MWFHQEEHETKFWIIFDTCTRAEYYRDLHKLVALPDDAVIRYDYKDKYLSEEALKTVKAHQLDSQDTPKKILLVYAQHRDHQKGQDRKHIPFKWDEAIWIPTRIAEMRLIVPEGECNYFDLRLCGYPNPRLQESLGTILTPLIESGDVPFQKWIATSEQVSLLADIEVDKGDNWQQIVNQLSSPPGQFVGDAFWRVVGLYDSTNAKTISSKEIERTRISNRRRIIRQVETLYHLNESRPYQIEVVSHAPSLSEKGISIPSRNLVVNLDPDSPISLEGSGSYELRQDTGLSISIRPKRYDILEDKVGPLYLTTEKVNKENDWPEGPELHFHFHIKYAWGKKLAGLYFVVGSTLALFVAPRAWDLNYPMWALMFACIGSFYVVLAAYRATGRMHATVMRL